VSEPKTKRTDASVTDFIDAVEPESKREDARTLLALMEDVTGEKPAMWGDSIIGFGSYDYVYATGNSGSWPKLAFSPRKRDTTVYLMDGTDRYPRELARLGPHRTGKSCLYLGRVSRLDLDVLREVVAASWKAPIAGE
jgi:hypothetical protein